MKQTRNSDSETHVKKYNRTCGTDLSCPVHISVTPRSNLRCHMKNKHKPCHHNLPLENKITPLHPCILVTARYNLRCHMKKKHKPCHHHYLSIFSTALYISYGQIQLEMSHEEQAQASSPLSLLSP